MKALTVYYSRTGITAEVARAVHEELGGDLEEIRVTRDRRGISGSLLLALEALLTMKAPIVEAKNEPGRYDLVVVGTPVWSQNMSTPVRAYLERYRASFKTTGFFVTCRGIGGMKVLRDMELLVGEDAGALLEIKRGDFRSGGYREKAGRFVRELLGPAG